jgi:hypothetical protein
VREAMRTQWLGQPALALNLEKERQRVEEPA